MTIEEHINHAMKATAALLAFALFIAVVVIGVAQALHIPVSPQAVVVIIVGFLAWAILGSGARSKRRPKASDTALPPIVMDRPAWTTRLRELRALEDCRARKIVSEEEYLAARADILGGLPIDQTPGPKRRTRAGGRPGAAPAADRPGAP